MKVAFSKGVHMHHNKVHGNHGPGIWFDIDNDDNLIEDNEIWDNLAEGIFYEISAGATIRRNHIRNCGQGHAGWVWGSGIVIAASKNCTIEDNMVEHCKNGIVFMQQKRGNHASGDHKGEVRTVYGGRVRNNKIIQSGASGVAQDNGDQKVFEDQVWAGNHYDPARFAWINHEFTNVA